MRPAIRRLMFVTDAPGFGGAERYIVDAARTARRRGMDAHLLWLPLPAHDANTFAGIRHSGIRMTAVEPCRTRSIPALARAIRAAINLHSPDALIINACGRPRFWSLPWLAHWHNIPAVWVHHMVDGRDHRRLPPHRLGGRVEGLGLWRVPQTLRHRLAAAAAAAVVVSNPEDRKSVIRWQGLSPTQVRVIPPGVDTERFQFDPESRRRLRAVWARTLGRPSERSEDRFVIGTAARLVEGKGVDLLIEALALLCRRVEHAVAVIAGTGPQRTALAALARARHVADRVHFVDFMADMPAFYSVLDAFALCSSSESFGLALTEAMACQRPVVATPTAGARLQIEHAVSGWQLNGFSPQELSDALCDLAADPRRREQMGRRARERVIQCFSIDRTLDQTLDVLRAQTRQAPAPFPRRPDTHNSFLISG